MVSDPESGRRVGAVLYAPPEALRAIVDCFWSTWWDLVGQPPHRTEVLSDPTVHIVLERGRSRVVGLHRARFSRLLEDRGRILAAKLWPGALAALTERPASSFTDRMEPLTALWDDADALEEEALAREDDDAALHVLIHALESRARPLEAGARRARAIVAHVTRTPGVVRVAQIEEEHQLDKRALQRLFERYVGASPKWVIRRVRLQEAAARLERWPEGSLAALAAELGYTDQAHFARDFKSVVGLTPAAFSKRLRDASG